MLLFRQIKASQPLVQSSWFFTVPPKRVKLLWSKHLNNYDEQCVSIFQRSKHLSKVNNKDPIATSRRFRRLALDVMGVRQSLVTINFVLMSLLLTYSRYLTTGLTFVRQTLKTFLHLLQNLLKCVRLYWDIMHWRVKFWKYKLKLKIWFSSNKFFWVFILRRGCVWRYFCFPFDVNVIFNWHINIIYFFNILVVSQDDLEVQTSLCCYQNIWCRNWFGWICGVAVRNYTSIVFIQWFLKLFNALVQKQEFNSLRHKGKRQDYTTKR